MSTPKNLPFPIAENDFKSFFARMGGEKKDMILGVPVLSAKDGEPFFSTFWPLPVPYQ